ncbi:hypothetical protein BKA80DRAFT_155 [Phyllosticta citrichinensis]
MHYSLLRYISCCLFVVRLFRCVGSGSGSGFGGRRCSALLWSSSLRTYVASMYLPTYLPCVLLPPRLPLRRPVLAMDSHSRSHRLRIVRVAGGPLLLLRCATDLSAFSDARWARSRKVDRGVDARR